MAYLASVNYLEPFFRCCPNSTCYRNVVCLFQSLKILGALGRTQLHLINQVGFLASIFGHGKNVHDYVLASPSPRLALQGANPFAFLGSRPHLHASLLYNNSSRQMIFGLLEWLPWTTIKVRQVELFLSQDWVKQSATLRMAAKLDHRIYNKLCR